MTHLLQSQNIKRGESEDITIEKHQFTQVDRNRGKKGTIEIQNNQKANDKMAVVRPYISIITLKVNGLNSPIKRHRVAGQIKKQDPTICCLQETHSAVKTHIGSK